MRIALYYSWIYLKGGIERTIVETVKRSRHEWTIFTSHYEEANTFNSFKDFDVRELSRVSVDRDMLSVLGAAIKIASTKLPLEGFDAFLLMTCGLGDLIVFRNHELPTLTVCHSPLRPVFDPVYAREAKKRRSMPSRLLYMIFQSLYKYVDKMAWRYFDKVFVISREVQNRVVTGGLVKSEKDVKIVHTGIDWHSFDRPVTYEDFFLLPGRIMWTKNVEMGVKAFLEADLPPKWRLVVAGFVDRKSRGYLDMLRTLSAGAGDRVIFEVNPSDQRLMELYSKAYCVLFTPLNEDWGLVPLEAMASAKPVIATASGGPLESIQDGKTGWLLPPKTEVWAKKMREMIDSRDEVIKMGQYAKQYSKQYDWSIFVEAVDNALEEIVQEK